MQGGVSCLLLLMQWSLTHGALTGGMLYPRGSESRMIQELEGMWNFRADTSSTRDAGLKEGWYTKPLSKVYPVVTVAQFNNGLINVNT